MPRRVTATYRLQLTRDFPFAEARALVPYLHDLGVSHLYLSPVLAAAPGSAHGYDVIDHGRVNPELGTEEELRALAHDLHDRDMGIILDIVPNHMAAHADNRCWDDVLERGASSRFVDWFDIDWDAPHARGKLILPVLGDELDRVLGRGEITLRISDAGSRIAYFDKTFPLDPATLPKEIQLAQLDPEGRAAADAWAAGEEGKKRLRRLLHAQHYRLRFWRRGQHEINYRRFFDVDDLVGVRMETDAVFDATHALILSWVRDGIVDGLRIDHVDGLRAPAWYLGKLRTAVDALRHPDAPARFPIVVEKILSGDETLPSDWPVDGTTGYDFMNDVEELFLDPAGFTAIEARYRKLRKPGFEFATVARNGKRQVLTGALRPDVARLARLAHAWRPEVGADEYAAAIVELIVHLDVYRTYVVEPGVLGEADRRNLTTAFRLARESGRASDAGLAILHDAFFAPPVAGDAARADLVARCQQTSGPATAKGIEDTALYVYMPLASRNEVGGYPDRPLENVYARVHARNAARARDWPRTLLATNTHDTKRSADLRARLDVLTTLPAVWIRHVARWRRLNKPRKRVVRGKPAPDINSEYLYYQTLLGLWPAPRPQRRVDDLPDTAWLDRTRARLVAYMLKAAREAKTRTSWTESDPQFETALDAFVRESLASREDAHFLGDVARLTAQTAAAGFRVALARVLLHCTAPGVPDLYQGDELWNFTLVDPDNRRLVDFRRRADLLASTATPEVLGQTFASNGTMDDRVKIALTARLLRFRREHPRLFIEGEYVPLVMTASGQEPDLFAFARRVGDEACIAAVRVHAPAGEEVSRSAEVWLPADMAGAWRSVLTGRRIELVGVASRAAVPQGELVPDGQPCELLFRDNA